MQKEQLNKPLLGCIADDFTGGTDLANTLVNGGMRTVQYLGTPEVTNIDAVDALVIALKTRTCPIPQAVSESLHALRFLIQAGCRQFFFKYCSTFDSTVRGNIGPVADALMKELETSFSIVCPAFPTNGRTVYKGHLFVNDVLISESSMKNHPLTPMTDANLVRFFSKQTKKRVFLVDHQYLQKGVSSLRKKLFQLRKSYEGYAVVDSICDHDLHLIGKAAHDFKLITGGSGVAIGLPDNFKREGLLDNSILSTKLPYVKGPSVILAGSCSAATNLQVKEWLRHGPSLKLNPVELMEGEQSIEDVLTWVQPYLKKGKAVLIYTTDTPDSVKVTQEKLGIEVAGNLVEETFSKIAVRLFELDIRSFILAGGETSGAVVKALGIKALRVGKQIDPGVPWTVSQSPPHIALALKSGNFGSPDFFIKTAGGTR